MIPEHSRVIIRVPNWIGDAVMSTAGLRLIHENRPDLKLTIVCKAWVVDLFQGHPAVTETIVHQPGKGILRVWDTLRLTYRIRRERFSAAVLFQTAFESALIPFLAGIPLRFGLPTDHRGGFINHKVNLTAVQKKSHQITFYQAIAAKAVMAKNFQFDPWVEIPEHNLVAADQIIQSMPRSDFIITVAPGAAYGAAKRWFPERFIEFTEGISQNLNANVIFCGSASDVNELELTRFRALPRIRVVAGRESLMNQVALIKRSNVCVSNDSGLMHIAYAVRTPVVALFGPTNPNATGPLGKMDRVIYHPMDCAPCGQKKCNLDHGCMSSITVEEVKNAVLEIISEKPINRDESTP